MQTNRSVKPLLLALLFLALAVLLVGGMEYIIRMLPPAGVGADSSDPLLAARPTILWVVRGAGIVLLLLAVWRFAVAFARALQPAGGAVASAVGAEVSESAEARAARPAQEPMALRVCPHCGTSNLLQAVYCEGCGNLLPAENVVLVPCRVCGHGNLEEARFCEACGAALTEPEGVAELCRECGFANPPGVAFCQRCGRALAASEPEGDELAR